jgi:hypothetical protein
MFIILFSTAQVYFGDFFLHYMASMNYFLSILHIHTTVLNGCLINSIYSVLICKTSPGTRLGGCDKGPSIQTLHNLQNQIIIHLK